MQDLEHKLDGVDHKQSYVRLAEESGIQQAVLHDGRIESKADSADGDATDDGVLEPLVVVDVSCPSPQIPRGLRAGRVRGRGSKTAEDDNLLLLVLVRLDLEVLVENIQSMADWLGVQGLIHFARVLHDELPPLLRRLLLLVHLVEDFDPVSGKLIRNLLLVRHLEVFDDDRDEAVEQDVREEAVDGRKEHSSSEGIVVDPHGRIHDPCPVVSREHHKGGEEA
mmetsp:Transcript_4126/g.9984  ORF Transcript_4126/g.9984 Transcript_4126/m.9984 type:complete len:223 (+) Transcript_4126:682-1350(+)